MKSQNQNPKNRLAVASAHAVRAGCFLILGIVSGAFGAHALKGALEPDALGAFQTASQYLLWMGCGMMAASSFGETSGMGWVALGTALFSLSIFALVGLGACGIEASWLGPLTPIGGVLMMGGWIQWVRSMWRAR